MQSQSITQNDEYSILLKTNEELTKRVKQLEEEKGNPSSHRSFHVQVANDNLGQVARTIESRIKELEDENRSLTMNKSHCKKNSEWNE